MQEFLASTEIVDWQDESVLATARRLQSPDSVATARNCFAWVRDEISHSFDHRRSELTCRASDVLEAGTGICFAKSHLLAALLRANGIAAGFGYQRLCVDGQGPPFSLHGFNFLQLADYGWVCADARGNRPDLHTEFAPEAASLAFEPMRPGEVTFTQRLAEPLPAVVAALTQRSTTAQLWKHLPDCELSDFQSYCNSVHSVSSVVN